VGKQITDLVMPHDTIVRQRREKNTLFDRVQIIKQIGLVVYPQKADICAIA